MKSVGQDIYEILTTIKDFKVMKQAKKRGLDFSKFSLAEKMDHLSQEYREVIHDYVYEDFAHMIDELADLSNMVDSVVEETLLMKRFCQ